VTAGVLAVGLAAGSAACLVALRPRGEQRLRGLGLDGRAPSDWAPSDGAPSDGAMSGRATSDGAAPAWSRSSGARSAGARSAGARPASPTRAVLLVVGCALLGVLLGPVPALLALVAVECGRRTLTARRRAASRAVERRQAVEACSALAAELRAGRSPAAALAVAADVATGPSRSLLRGAAAAAQLGGDVPGALTAPGPTGISTTAVPEVLRSLAACWTVCATFGSGLAVAVDRLEEGLRADQDRRRAVAAELAGPRATAAMLALLPGAGLLLAVGLGADPAGVLLETPLGLVCLTVGLGLDGLGLLWTHRLVARAGGV